MTFYIALGLCILAMAASLTIAIYHGSKMFSDK